MKIWTFVNYAMLPEHGPMNRHYYFGKYLARMGHQDTVFAGSHPHNTDLQLIQGRELYKVWQEVPFRWVYVKTCNYSGSRIKQVLSMFAFYFNSIRTAKQFVKNGEIPDVIIGSSAHPLCALLAIRLGKKYHCKRIVEVRDLWPESIVTYGILGRRNPIIQLMYCFEKYLYAKADAIIFTMEGGADYIRERKWDTEHGGPVDLKKVHHINNGVDLELFDYNREHFRLDDPDLDDPDLFKVVYTGSIRKANNIGALLDAAKLVKNKRIRFLIWGNGNEEAALEERVRNEQITNVVFKGVVEKKFIPAILERADISLLFYEVHDICKYGGSQNKLFDYLASGTPVLTSLMMGYDLLDRYDCGYHVTDFTPQRLAEALDRILFEDENTYKKLSENAKTMVQHYDFQVLTEKLLNTIDSIPKEEY